GYPHDAIASLGHLAWTWKEDHARLMLEHSANVLWCHLQVIGNFLRRVHPLDNVSGLWCSRHAVLSPASFPLWATKTASDGPRYHPAIFPCKNPHKSTALLRIISLSLASVDCHFPDGRLACTRRRKKPLPGACLLAAWRRMSCRFPARVLPCRRGIPGC